MERYAWLKRPGSCLLFCEEAVDKDSLRLEKYDTLRGGVIVRRAGDDGKVFR